MTWPDDAPEHVVEALRDYDLVVDRAQQHVRAALPDLDYRVLLGHHQTLGDAADVLCSSLFDGWDKEITRVTLVWVRKAIGRSIDVPKTHEQRVALVVDLWLARYQ